MDNTPKPHGRVRVEGLAPARKSGGSTDPANSTPAPSSPFRIGHGYDIHRLQTGGKLIIGGVVVSDQISAIAHSDGDVAIHALVDALLGAMGWGDIGEQFSPLDDQWKNAASSGFLRVICDRVSDAGFEVVNADITLMAEQPRIAPFKKQMAETLRQILGTQSIVNVKAGTNEGCDAVGRGEAVAAHAVILLSAKSPVL